jgi:hypothetical protein
MSVPSEQELRGLISDWYEKATGSWDAGARLADSGDSAQAAECNGLGDGYSRAADALSVLLGHPS